MSDPCTDDCKDVGVGNKHDDKFCGWDDDEDEDVSGYVPPVSRPTAIPRVTLNGLPLVRGGAFDDNDTFMNMNPWGEFCLKEDEPVAGSPITIGLGKLRRLTKKELDQYLSQIDHENSHDCLGARL